MLKEELLPLFFALYPEIHYRFKYFPFSFYFKKEPEIIIDLPYKTIKGKKVPVFLIVKNGDKYPVKIVSLHFNFLFNDKSQFEQMVASDIDINFSIFQQSFFFDFPDKKGETKLLCTVTVEINGKRKEYVNDNFNFKEKELSFFLNDDEELFEGMVQGDLHYHSDHTADQVEFGAPLLSVKECGLALGLDFVFVTDHSYDLDDCVNNYLQNDPNIPIYRKMKKECQEISDEHFQLINGEEVTVRNQRGRNVHLVLAGEEKFYHGSGDSAEKWTERNSKFSINEIAADVSNQALLMAAHPFTPTPLLEFLLIKRGEWQDEDIAQKRIDLIQILNGEKDDGFWLGRKKWIKMLLSGDKRYIGAGNDAHGNFSCFRQISLPMFKMVKLDRQLFGRCRTVVSSLNEKKELLSKLKAGNSYITEGPHLDFYVIDIKSGRKFGCGCSLDADRENLEIAFSVRSSEFSGKIISICIFAGVFGGKEEEIMYKNNFQNESLYKYAKNIHLSFFDDISYIRIEVESLYGNNKKMAMSNPIWFV